MNFLKKFSFVCLVIAGIFIFTTAAEGAVKLDLIFVIDLTGSMGDDIDEVKDQASEIVDDIAESISDYRIAIVGYRDFGDTPMFEDYPFSRDKEEILENINSLSVHGGGDWPEEPVTVEFDYVDLVWHECEFRERFSFSYVLRDADGGYLGCAYLYPMGRRTELTEALARHDVDVSWWVTGEAYEAGYYEKAHEGLRRWVTGDFPFTDPYWSNSELPAR